MGERLKGKVAVVTGAGSVGRGVGNRNVEAQVLKYKRKMVELAKK